MYTFHKLMMTEMLTEGGSLSSVGGGGGDDKEKEDIEEIS